MRQVVLAAALLMIALLGSLTITVIVQEGFGPLELVSIVVLAMFAFGIVGALRHPPEE